MTIFDDPASVPAPPGRRYSHLARIDLGAKTMLILSGQVALDSDGHLVGDNDMTAQAAFIMDNITAILAAHGASLGDVVNIRSYLTDMNRLAEYGTVRAARFSGSTPKPTSTTVEVSRLFVPGALLEVEVLAVR
jgi:2-iminobutanoate/2-iminopropanoate deaminase